MGHRLNVKKAFIGLLLAPFYVVEEMESEKKLRERLARLEKREVDD